MDPAEPTPLPFKVLAVLLLVGVNAVFVAAEIAFLKLRRTQLGPPLARGQRRAQYAKRLSENLEACVSTTQVGITLCGVGLGAIVEPVFDAVLRPVFVLLNVTSPTWRSVLEFGVGFTISTFVLIVVGELVPKAIAIRQTLGTALWTAGPVTWFHRAVFPFVWLLNHAASAVLRPFGIRPINESEAGRPEEELRLLLAAAQQPAGTTELGRNLLLNALDLRQRVVREVMRPRRDIVAFDTRAEMAQCLELAERTRYSRFPLCENGDLDRTLGVVHFKDLYALRLKARTGSDLLPVAKKLVYVPETARLERLLQTFLDRRLHLAIVVDEYGGTVGMITLENILEELVGQIQDEFDQELPRVVPLGKGEWEIDGALPLHELAELLGQPLREADVTTAGGLVTLRLGRFPSRGEKVQLGPSELEVAGTEGRRVTRLKVKKPVAGD